MTPGLCLATIRKDGVASGHVPWTMRDSGLCLAAVCQDPVAIGSIPVGFLTPDLCHEAVIADGLVLGGVAFMMRGFCLAAVRQDDEVLRSVPRICEPGKMPDLPAGTWRALRHVPATMLTPRILMPMQKPLESQKTTWFEAYYKASFWQISTMQAFTSASILAEGCRSFVAGTLWCARGNWKPRHPQGDWAPCLEAIRQNPTVLSLMPRRLMTADLCLVVVRNDGKSS
jgi:hypothetical protein